MSGWTDFPATDEVRRLPDDIPVPEQPDFPSVAAWVQKQLMAGVEPRVVQFQVIDAFTTYLGAYMSMVTPTPLAELTPAVEVFGGLLESKLRMLEAVADWEIDLDEEPTHGQP